MTQQPISSRVEAFARATAPFMRFFSESPYARKAGKPGVNDFAVGNPHELALPGIVTALQKWAVPQNERWFAYKISEPEPQEVVAASLRKWRGIPFEPADIALTIAGFAAIAAGLKAVTEPGDEVDLQPPAVVLLRGALRRGRDHTCEGEHRARDVRPRSRRDLRRDHARGRGSSSSTRRTIRPGGSTRPRR